MSAEAPNPVERPLVSRVVLYDDPFMGSDFDIDPTGLLGSLAKRDLSLSGLSDPITIVLDTSESLISVPERNRQGSSAKPTYDSTTGWTITYTLEAVRDIANLTRRRQDVPYTEAGQALGVQDELTAGMIRSLSHIQYMNARRHIPNISPDKRRAKAEQKGRNKLKEIMEAGDGADSKWDEWKSAFNVIPYSVAAAS